MRGYVIGGAGIVSLGLLIVALATVWNHLTRNDGGGANIGAGLLGFLGFVVAAIGLVMVIIATGSAVLRRLRSAPEEQ